jgi:hypothetical protein
VWYGKTPCRRKRHRNAETEEVKNAFFFSFFSLEEIKFKVQIFGDLITGRVFGWGRKRQREEEKEEEKERIEENGREIDQGQEEEQSVKLEISSAICTFF